MSEKEKQIMETFGKLIPTMSECEKSYLLGYGEGMGAKIGLQVKMEEAEQAETV